MASIDNLKTLIDYQVSDGKKKIPCYVNDDGKTPINCIRLFYMFGTSFVSTSKAPYYNDRIQVACRHNDYDRGRTLAYDILERINTNRKTYSGVYYIPDTVPDYAGIDKSGGYVWTFEILMKGGR